MPNPAAGSGPAISKDLRKYVSVLYLATAASGASYPAFKLGNTEPTGGWTRQGRLKDEDITWNVPDPQFLEGRVGFNNSLKFRVVKQAEIPQMTLRFDEADPNVQALLRGSSYTALSSSIYTGQEFIYKTGQYYSCKVLIVGTDVASTREHHVFAANAVVTYKPVTDPAYEGLEAIVTLLDVSSSETFRIREWD